MSLTQLQINYLDKDLEIEDHIHNIEKLSQDASNLIGQIVYFEAQRVARIPRHYGPGHSKYYDLIPGTTIKSTTWGGVLIASHGGLYSRKLEDIVTEKSLYSWMAKNPKKSVLRELST